jgi:threonine dehydrogenase-like Zn-dependent dehydrogenase
METVPCSAISGSESSWRKGDGVGRFGLGDRVCGYGGIRETQIIDAVEDPFLFRGPDPMPWKSALCLDPAQFALGGIRDGHVRLGDRVAVFGLGAIGAIAAQMARAAGAVYVAVVDPIQKRRGAAVEVGADASFDPLREDVGLELKKATNRAGVDAAIETSGSEQALQQALRGLGYGGTIASVGWAAGLQRNPGAGQGGPLQQRQPRLLPRQQRTQPGSPTLGPAAHRDELLEHARLGRDRLREDRRPGRGLRRSTPRIRGVRGPQPTEQREARRHLRVTRFAGTHTINC